MSEKIIKVLASIEAGLVFELQAQYDHNGYIWYWGADIRKTVDVSLQGKLVFTLNGKDVIPMQGHGFFDIDRNLEAMLVAVNQPKMAGWLLFTPFNAEHWRASHMLVQSEAAVGNRLGWDSLVKIALKLKKVSS